MAKTKKQKKRKQRVECSGERMAVISSEENKFEKEGIREEEKGEEDEEKEEESEELVVKWANHYSSVQHILLVGEGDFSFSLCLSSAFGSASNIVATSLDSHDTVLKKYRKARSNLEKLKKFGATILHQIDATKMKFHTDLKMRKFDRIVYNFPHAGFKGKEDNMRLINLHRKLVNGFFKNASHMLRPYGEVHVSHKIGGPFHKWNLEELALRNSLILAECANFSIEDYPGYNNKKGDGPRCDQPFPLGECRTFKFRIGDIHKKNRAQGSFAETTAANPSHFEILRSNHLPPTFYPHESWGRANHLYNVEGIPSMLCCPPRIGISNLYLREPGCYGLDTSQLFRKIEDPLRLSCQPWMNEEMRKAEFGYLKHLEELQRQNVARHASLRDPLFRYELKEEARLRQEQFSFLEVENSFSDRSDF